MKSKNTLFGSSAIVGVGALVAAPLLAISCSNVQSEILGLVTDAGSVNDGSFNESSWEGLKSIYNTYYNRNIKESSFVSKPKNQESGALINSYSQRLRSKNNVIVTPGFFHEAAIWKFNKDNRYDEKNKDKQANFLGLDFDMNSNDSYKYRGNVATVVYEVAKAGFFAGYLTGDFLKEKEIINPIVSTYGGANFPGVTDFMSGFVHGIEYWNENNAATPETDANKMKWATFSSDDDYLNSGFEAGEKGKTKAQHLLIQNTNVILPVSGPQVSEVAQEINKAKRDKKGFKSYVIGVDSDQAKKYPEFKELFITSILKNLKESVFALFSKIMLDSKAVLSEDANGNKTYFTEELINQKGKLIDPNFNIDKYKDSGLGKKLVGTMDNNLVGLAFEQGAFKEELSQEQQEKIKAKISDSSINAYINANSETIKNWNSALDKIKANSRR